jgi:hypothetical protein
MHPRADITDRTSGLDSTVGRQHLQVLDVRSFLTNIPCYRRSHVYQGNECRPS